MQIVPCPTIDGSSFVQLDEKGYNHYFKPHKQGLTSMLIFKIPGCAGFQNVKCLSYKIIQVDGFQSVSG